MFFDSFQKLNAAMWLAEKNITLVLKPLKTLKIGKRLRRVEYAKSVDNNLLSNQHQKIDILILIIKYNWQFQIWL